MTLPEDFVDTDIERDELFPVWPENWPIVEAFMMCDTQWVVAGMGGVVGMNYSGVATVLSMYNITDPEVFAGIQIMERAALKVMNRERK